ncbi:MAG: AMP-binding protein [Deltaproteobacteria bacterium]|nr:AMP-binding protein [Deltaproteobacteria bacterium]
MNHFVHKILSNLEAWPDRLFAVEVHGSRLVSTEGRRLRALVEIARRGLRDHGVVAGDRVVLVAPNSTRWIATDLAILAEGATVVPMYARQDPKELAGMVRDADPKLVITLDETLRDAIAAHVDVAPFLLLPELFTSAAPSELEPARPLASDHPVTIIYTSGSSGEPKGVITSVANAEHMLPVLDVKLRELAGAQGGSDRVFHYLPFCFAGSRMVLWGCLFRANGIMMSTSLENLAEEIKTARPEYFLNVPALLERIKSGVEKKIAERAYPIRAGYAEAIAAWRRLQLAKQGKGESRKRDELVVAAAKRVIFKSIRAQIGTQIKGLVCGSAPLPEEVQRWFVELLEIPVFQVYGLTETTAIVTIDRRDATVSGRVGHAIRDVEMKLGDEGELLVRGPNIFPGYFRREEATRAAFTEDGWFRTGDQCTIDERGNLAVIGRVKNLLVPTSGHNVAPEPIEERVLQCVPGVEQAVVIGHARPYLTVILTGDVDASAIEAGLEKVNEGLPHYRRLRKAHVAREKLTPENGLLTANQKLRRSAIERHFAKEIEALYA